MPTVGDLFYRAVDAAFAVDGQQRIIYWDPGCEELFDRSSDWVLGRPCCDVIRGVSPVNGVPFCKEGCSVANLAKGGDGPKSFPLQSCGGAGRQLPLNVNICLVPSDCKKGWVAMHLLHLGPAPGTLNAIDAALRPERSPHSAASSAVTSEMSPRRSRLSPREREVLQLLAEGLSSTTIGKRLSISLTTVRNHVQHIQGKLGVHSQTEAVAYAYRHSLVA